VDTKGAPEGICGSHLPDQGGDLGVEGRATSGGSGRAGPSTRGSGGAASAGRCRARR
jgi:hypothetical protein